MQTRDKITKNIQSATLRYSDYQRIGNTLDFSKKANYRKRIGPLVQAT